MVNYTGKIREYKGLIVMLEHYRDHAYSMWLKSIERIKQLDSTPADAIVARKWFKEFQECKVSIARYKLRIEELQLEQARRQMRIPDYYDCNDELDIMEIIERKGFIGGHGF